MSYLLQLEEICFLLKIFQRRNDILFHNRGSFHSCCCWKQFKRQEFARGLQYVLYFHCLVHWFLNNYLRKKTIPRWTLNDRKKESINYVRPHFYYLLSNCSNLASSSCSWIRVSFIFFDLTGCRISAHVWSKVISSSFASILEETPQDVYKWIVQRHLKRLCSGWVVVVGPVSVF